MDSDLRVLLMSPMRGRDPESGDITYTEMLLHDPPPGVRYIAYPQAVESGSLAVRGRRPRHGRFRSLDAVVLGIRAVESALRRQLMFREPFWYVTVDRGQVDLIHQHLFAVRQLGTPVPAVSSAGFPLAELYHVQDGWSRPRASVAERLDRSYARIARAHSPGVWAPHDDVMTVYTPHFRDYILRSGYRGPVRVCGQGLPLAPGRPRCSDGQTLTFVGRDLRRKGGFLALEAFELLRNRGTQVRLNVVTRAGELARGSLPDGVELFEDVPRDAVLQDILPSTDVLLLPTAADCGAPYGVIEALQQGIPVVMSDSPWLDPRLVSPAVVRVGRAASEVASAAERLLDPRTREVASRAAVDLWRSAFSMDALHAALLTAYRQACDR